MPRFVNTNDIDFFKSINNELVETVVETPIVLFKLNITDTKVNLYGESLAKSWDVGVQIFSLITHERQTTKYEGFGADANQNTIFKFSRDRLEQKSIYPEVGDIIEWNTAYWEISNVVENQLLGNQIFNNFSIVVETFMSRKSSLNIEEKNR